MKFWKKKQVEDFEDQDDSQNSVTQKAPIPPETEQEKQELKKKVLKHRLKISALVAVFFFIFFAPSIFIEINSGERGVLWSRFFGGTKLNEGYGEGITIIFPWDKMYIYSVRAQEINESITFLSEDGLTLNVTASARFHPIKKKIPYLHQEFGPNYIDKLVRPEMISGLRQVIGNYRPAKIYAEDEDTKNERGILKELQHLIYGELEPHNIRLQDVMLVHLELPKELRISISKKLVEQQKSLAYTYILEQERKEKERKEIEADGIAEFEKRSKISILKWSGIEATRALATSPNSKVVIIGTDSKELPVILNTEK